MAWTLLRRSSSLLALPGLMILAVLLLHSRSGWEWEWQLMLSRAAGTSMLLAPAVAGLAAFDTVRLVPRETETFMRGTRRQQWLPVLAAFPAWICGVVALIFAAGVAVVRALLVGAPVYGAPWHILIGIGGLWASACLGVLAAVMLRNVAAPPLVAVAVYLLELELDNRLGTLVFAEDGATTAVVGLLPDVAGVLVIVALQLSVGGVLSLVAGTLWTSTRPRSVPVIAGGVVGVLVLVPACSYVHNRQAMIPWRAADTEWVCGGDAPRVCVARENAHLLDSTVAAVHAAAAPLYDADAAVPAVFRQETRTVNGPSDWTPGEGLLALAASRLDNGRISEEDVVVSLSMPRLCPQYFDYAAPGNLLQTQLEVQRWIQSKTGSEDAYPYLDSEVIADDQVADAYRVLMECPPDDQIIPPVTARR